MMLGRTIESEPFIATELLEEQKGGTASSAREAAVGCFDHPKEAKPSETRRRARFETNGCILFGVGTPRTKFMREGCEP